MKNFVYHYKQASGVVWALDVNHAREVVARMFGIDQNNGWLIVTAV